jgi:hypothetical protein
MLIIDEIIIHNNEEKKVFKNNWAFKRYMRRHRLARLSGTLNLRFSGLNEAALREIANPKNNKGAC